MAVVCGCAWKLLYVLNGAFSASVNSNEDFEKNYLLNFAYYYSSNTSYQMKYGTKMVKESYWKDTIERTFKLKRKWCNLKKLFWRSNMRKELKNNID